MTTQTLTPGNGNSNRLIRRAEGEIAAGRAIVAIGLLNEVLRMEPQNSHAEVLVKRAEAILQQKLHNGSGIQGSGNGLEAERYLAISSSRDNGGERMTGPPVKGNGGLSVETQIRILTTCALNLFYRNAPRDAMQSLIKAKLLDASSPLVRDCEQQLRSILPEPSVAVADPGAVRIKAAADPIPGKSLATTLEELQHMRELSRAGRIPAAAPRSVEPRLEALKRQKEIERREREMVMWREVARPLNEKTGAPAPRAKVRAAGPPKPKAGGFFSKIRQVP